MIYMLYKYHFNATLSKCIEVFIILFWTFIIYLIRSASVILIVVFTCKDVCLQANIVGRKIVAHSGLKPATSELHAIRKLHIGRGTIHTALILMNLH